MQDGATKRIRVLVAEDTATGRQVIRNHLDHDGFELSFAEDGAQAVAAAARQDFDVLLMDLHMPVMDGWNAIRHIRHHEAREAKPRTPIVVVSANSAVEDVRASMEAGADAHLGKPVSRMDVVGVVLEFASRE